MGTHCVGTSSPHPDSYHEMRGCPFYPHVSLGHERLVAFVGAKLLHLYHTYTHTHVKHTVKQKLTTGIIRRFEGLALFFRSAFRASLREFFDRVLNDTRPET